MIADQPATDLYGAIIEYAARSGDLARCANQYVACMREFSETAAGNLSDCCAEFYQALDEAVDALKAASVAVDRAKEEAAA